MINVTKTYLPPLDEYVDYLKKIWASGQVSNNGALLRELEEALKSHLGVEHLFITANGTLALQLAIKALGLSKQVITTPYSYVATTTSLLWEGCTPVFVDIKPTDFTMDAGLIERAIGPDTEAILAVHVYGYPCAVDAIEDIARRRRLKVIYDAAHAFGTKLDGRAIVGRGDLSVMSFHATKCFHMVEGGAVVTNNPELARKIRLYRAFGHIGDDQFSMGINAKNSEMHAAIGLCVLPRMEEFLAARARLAAYYDGLLANSGMHRPSSEFPGLTYNYAYYPVVFRTEAQLLATKHRLEAEQIMPRRYYYPSLNRLPYLSGQSCPVSEDLAVRTLCLPFYPGLPIEVVDTIVEIVKTEYSH